MQELAALADSDRIVALHRFRILQPHLEHGRPLIQPESRLLEEIGGLESHDRIVVERTTTSDSPSKFFGAQCAQNRRHPPRYGLGISHDRERSFGQTQPVNSNLALEFEQAPQRCKGRRSDVVMIVLIDHQGRSPEGWQPTSLDYPTNNDLISARNDSKITLIRAGVSSCQPMMRRSDVLATRKITTLPNRAIALNLASLPSEGV